MFSSLKSLLGFARSDAMDTTVEDRVWQAVVACKGRSELPMRGRRREGCSLPEALTALGNAIEREAAEKASRA
jgi:hypothetical protein